jgi:hypothetical protein
VFKKCKGRDTDSPIVEMENVSAQISLFVKLKDSDDGA